jgi:hypothetical protein
MDGDGYLEYQTRSSILVVAQQLMAVLSWIMGARDDAAEYQRSAAALKERFNRDWWVEDDELPPWDGLGG